MNVPMENYLLLADAIVMQAVQDYRRLCKRSNRRPDDWKIKYDMSQCRRFFASGWFSTLSDADGVVIMEMIERDPDLVIRKQRCSFTRKRGKKSGKETKRHACKA